MRTKTDDRNAVLDKLQQLEEEFASGALTEAEYIDLRDEQTVRAAQLLRDTPENPELRDESRAMRHSHPSVRMKKKRVLIGMAVFVVLACGVLATTVHTRSSGDEITGSTGQNINTLLQKAQDQTGKSDAVDAVKTYDKVLAIDPNNAQALAYKGWLIYLAGLPNEGQQSIQKAIAAQPNYPDAHFFNGYILLRVRNDPKDAIGEFQAFLNNNPPQDMVAMVQQAMQDAQALAKTTN